MRTVMLPIDRCWPCQWQVCGGDKETRCGHPKVGERVPETGFIPEWCPLADEGSLEQTQAKLESAMEILEVLFQCKAWTPPGLRSRYEALKKG